MLSSFLNELKFDRKYDYKSPYLTSLIEFLTKEGNENDKSILFINQRIIAEAFYKKLTQIFYSLEPNHASQNNGETHAKNITTLIELLILFAKIYAEYIYSKYFALFFYDNNI